MEGQAEVTNNDVPVFDMADYFGWRSKIIIIGISIITIIIVFVIIVIFTIVIIIVAIII